MPGRLSQASRFRQQGKHNRTSAAERSEIRREAVRPLPLQDALPCPGLAHPGFHSKSSLVFFPLPSNHPMKNSRVIPEEPTIVSNTASDGAASSAALTNCILYYNNPNYYNCRLSYCCTTPLTLESVLKSTFLWSADAPQHHADHRKVKHSLRIFDFGFVVAYKAAVLHKPAEGALDDPAPGQHFEAALVLETGDNFQAQAAGLAMRGDPGSKSSPPIALIGPDTTQPTKPLKGLGEESASAGLLGNIGRGHTNPEQQAQGVHQNVALAPFDLLA